MDEKRIWTIQDIADYTGYTRAHINALKREIPAKRLKRGPCRFPYNAEFGKWLEMMKKKKAVGSQRVRPSRAGRNNRRRQQKIDKLMEILKNKTEVDAYEKEMAIGFFKSMFALLYARSGCEKPRPVFPLLEGIEALFKSDLLFVDRDLAWLDDDIKQLPTKPQTG